MSIPDPERSVNTKTLTGTERRVLEALRLRLRAPELAYAAPPRPLSGGFWAEMFLLDLVNTPSDVPDRTVVRIAPDPRLARWETTVQQGVVDQGFAAARIYAQGGPDDAVGRAWSLMDFLPGEPLLAGLSGRSAIVRLPMIARRLPRQLATITARLHALDAEPIHAELRRLTNDPVGVEGLLAHLSVRADELGTSRLRRAARWLATHRPPDGKVVVCHGDIHPFNVLADGPRVALVDWTTAQIAHPAYDVAFTSLMLATPPLDLPARLRPTINRVAARLSRSFVSRYCRLSGTSIDENSLRWHTGLHSLRILLEVDGWAATGSEHHAAHPWNTIAPTLRRSLEQLTRA